MERLSGATQLLYSELLQQGLHGLPLDKGISFVQRCATCHACVWSGNFS